MSPYGFLTNEDTLLFMSTNVNGRHGCQSGRGVTMPSDDTGSTADPASNYLPLPETGFRGSSHISSRHDGPARTVSWGSIAANTSLEARESRWFRRELGGLRHVEGEFRLMAAWWRLPVPLSQVGGSKRWRNWPENTPT